MLLLDAGNSRLKWRYVSNESTHDGHCQLDDLDALTSAWADVPAPSRILASNVAGSHVALRLADICSRWPVMIEFIQARPRQCGVTNRYTQPAQLGSDRWAALIAAWNQTHRACLVVNSGTATTIDTLSDSGEFLGGLILPGLALMHQSLTQGTAQLGSAGGHLAAHPRNTADAIASGAISATLGAIRLQYAQLGNTEAPCLLCGGAAPMLAPLLGLPLLQTNHLVLQGLQLIAQEVDA